MTLNKEVEIERERERERIVKEKEKVKVKEGENCVSNYHSACRWTRTRTEASESDD